MMAAIEQCRTLALPIAGRMMVALWFNAFRSPDLWRQSKRRRSEPRAAVNNALSLFSVTY
jgi:hypothetical protein